MYCRSPGPSIAGKTRQGQEIVAERSECQHVLKVARASSNFELARDNDSHPLADTTQFRWGRSLCSDFRYQIRTISVSGVCYASYDQVSASFRNTQAVPTWPRLMAATSSQLANA